MPNSTDVSKSGGPVRILAVDDNAAALYATSRILRSAGFEVIEATTGAAALAASSGADLIVLDVNLPDMDGFEVCRLLRARSQTAHLPVLHLSATFTSASDQKLGFEAGADSYLTRPVEGPVLIATVRTLLFARNADIIRRGLDAKLRSMFNLAPVAIATIDSEDHFESVNPAFCALTGYAADKLVGRGIAEFVTSDLSDFHQGSHAESANDSSQIYSLQFQKRGGTLCEMEWQTSKEQISGIRIVVASDVTQRRAVETARDNLLASERAARAEAERSNRSKEEFLATLSHELRNPLNAILGWANVLMRTSDVPESVKHGLRAIERNSKLQAQMIADLLDYAGISFGKMRIVTRSVDALTAVRAAVDVVSSIAHAAAVEIEVHSNDEVLWIEADETRLVQIFSNLLSNAVKFSSRGGRVRIEAGSAGKDLRVVVSDRGIGISEDFLPRIFERFSQQDPSITRSHGGLGLGLAIVKQLVEAHEGTIRADSDGPGQGARFTINIPLSAAQTSPQVSDSQLLRSLDFSSLTIMVVEDDEDARQLTKRFLTDVGARVIDVGSADEAIRKIESSGADILICDIGMAKVDGYELIRRLRNTGWSSDSLPAIALTAFSSAQDRTDALTAGFQDHLVKPIEPQTLLTRIALLR